MTTTGTSCRRSASWKDPTGSVEPLEESLREFRSLLPLVASGGEIGSDATARLSDHRTKIQAELRSVMSRTERRGRAGGGDPMLHVSEMTADLDVNDVEAYLGARDIAKAVGAPGVTEYWKSAPYLLSFMDRYPAFRQCPVRRGRKSRMGKSPS